MPWGAAIAAVGSVAGGLIGSGASQSAADTQAAAADRATQAQLQMFNTTQGNLAPWMGAGRNALLALQAGLGLPGNYGAGATGPGGTVSAPTIAAPGGAPAAGSGTPNSILDPTTGKSVNVTLPQGQSMQFLPSQGDGSGPGTWAVVDGSGSIVRSFPAGMDLQSAAQLVGPAGGGGSPGQSAAAPGTPGNFTAPQTYTDPANGGSVTVNLPIGYSFAPVAGPDGTRGWAVVDGSGNQVQFFAGNLQGAAQGLAASPIGSAPSNFGSLTKPFTAADFQSSPGYQFQLQQGIDAITNSAAARGGLGGNTLVALQKYGTGLANGDWWNAYNAYTGRQNQIYNMLSGLSGSGQNAAANLGSIGTQVGNQIGNNIIGAGNAAAAGTIGSANAIAGGIGGAANGITNYLNNNALLTALQSGGSANGFGAAVANQGFGAYGTGQTYQ